MSRYFIWINILSQNFLQKFIHYWSVKTELEEARGSIFKSKTRFYELENWKNKNLFNCCENWQILRLLQNLTYLVVNLCNLHWNSLKICCYCTELVMFSQLNLKFLLSKNIFLAWFILANYVKATWISQRTAYWSIIM